MTETPPPRSGRFALLLEALRGSNRDLTSGPLAPAVFVLAVPMALEMVGESIFAVVDAFFIIGFELSRIEPGQSALGGPRISPLPPPGSLSGRRFPNRIPRPG